MKVKVISRNPDDYLRETKNDIFKTPRNYDPALHPFQQSREYVRALNAAKLERVFAKPFLASLDGHLDGLNCLSKHPSHLSILLSGSFDGQVKLWNVTQKKCLSTINAHAGFVRGICTDPTGETFFTVGDDKCVKQWPLQETVEPDEPLLTLLSKYPLQDITHHWKDAVFATCGEGVSIWDQEHSSPIRSFVWGVDTIYKVRFNPVECVMKLKSNAVAWNPVEAFTFTVANEDYNLYTFDMRRMSTPVNVHMDHTEAVMDVDYSPTGQEFVSGGYDKVVRIFRANAGRSREVYHTKRMQRVRCVLWSSDDRYILSGSDEMNIRLWKARASEKLGPLHIREKRAFEYAEKLKDKYRYHPEVNRILRHRQVPKHVYNARNELRAIHESHRRKEANLRLHSAPGTVPYISERAKHVVGEEQ
ncbi:unnamed protein product [Soboliphyme baturini]|uniref:DDB1- and CUL4-associated factor 13 n=1 Tax=Soboliphyme baturini TaxID=241478 RepID=A0A183IR06_9BILA|nr:unnamed protein product [Soboliphyme baturini]